ncbi:MAG: hypothetical protein AAF502_08350 [Bacteroidota bacterium]
MAAFVFFAIAFWISGYHETWRDEYQAWLIADTAESFSKLITNHKYEGQPIFWHCLLWLFSQFGMGFGAVKIFHLAIAATTVGLIWRFAPFLLIINVLLSFGYYFLFEYSIIVRPYGLAVLGLVLFCIFYKSKSRHLVWLALAIGLVANTQTYGVVLAGWLALLWLWKAFQPDNAFPLREKLIGGTIIGLSFVAAAVMIFPEPDNGFVNPAQPTLEAWKIAEVFDGYLRAHLPIPKPGKLQFWNSNIIDSLPRLVTGATGFFLFLFWLFCFRKEKKWLIFFLTGIGLFLLTNYLLLHYPFPRNYRHSGHYFMILLACSWLFLQNEKSGNSKIRNHLWLNSGLLIILFFQLIATLMVVVKEVSVPFSNSKATVEYIRENELSKLPIVNTGDAEMTSISGAIDQSIYYLNRNAYGSFAIWKKFAEIQPNDIEKSVLSFLKNNDLRECLYMSTSPLESLQIYQVATFGNPNVTKESFFLYLVHVE